MTPGRVLCNVGDPTLATVLIVEDDRAVAEGLGHTLQSVGFGVTIVNSGTAGLRAARHHRFAVILLDIHLPDLDGIEVLRALAGRNSSTRVVVMSGHLTVRSTVEMMQLGASNVLEKPIGPEQLVAVVTASTARSRGAADAEPVAGRQLAQEATLSFDNHSVANRWASYVLKGCLAADDSRTLAMWARRVGASSTMIAESCAILGIKAHDARDLMRALYAMLQGGVLQCPPQVLLDVADYRTLQGFRRRAGPDFQATSDIALVNRFLDSQGFVDPRNHGVTVLRCLLAKALSEQVA